MGPLAALLLAASSPTIATAQEEGEPAPSERVDSESPEDETVEPTAREPDRDVEPEARDSNSESEGDAPDVEDAPEAEDVSDVEDALIVPAVPTPEAEDEEEEEAEPDLVSEIVRELMDTVSLYGSLRVRLVVTENQQELQNGASRLGLRVHREIDSFFSIIGRLEVQVNLVESPTILTVGDGTNTELMSAPNADAFRTRLGWVGLQFGPHGSLTFGKQWGVYYDVAGWTDRFYVFGGTSLGVFNGGTDGSYGTGRAEQAITGRLNLGPISWGAQYQARGLSLGNAHALGTSLRLRVARWLQVGAAYNHVLLDAAPGGILAREDPKTFTAGFRIGVERLTLAFAFAYQIQNEIGLQATRATLIDAYGFELYVRYGITEEFGVFAGGNWRDADDAALDEGEGIHHYYFGLDWHFDRRALAYLQGRVALEGGDHAGVVGLRVGFDIGPSAVSDELPVLFD